MSSGNFLTMGSILYSFLLIIVFSFKKKIKSLENNIYFALIIANFFGLIIAVLCYFTVLHYNSFPALNNVVSRAYLIYLLVFIFLFFYYLLAVISKEQNQLSKLSKNILRIVLVTFIICSIVIFYLPLYYHNDSGIVYSYDPAANLIYAIATLCMSSWSVLLIVNYKKIKDKKFLPIIIFIIGAMIITIIQKINPGLLIMTSMETFVTVLMYFTIENPDLELLREVHNAKVYADNSNYDKTMFLFNMSHDIKDINDEIYSDANDILKITKSEDVKEISRNIISNTAKYNTMINGNAGY